MTDAETAFDEWWAQDGDRLLTRRYAARIAFLAAWNRRAQAEATDEDLRYVLRLGTRSDAAGTIWTEPQKAREAMVRRALRIVKETPSDVG